MHLEPKRRKQTKNIKKTPKNGCNEVGRNQVLGSPKKCSENKKGQKNFGVYPLKHIITSKNVHIHIRMYKYKLL